MIGLKWFTCCEMDSVWYGKLTWVFFDTFTKVRTCGQHPGRMSRVGGHLFVLSFLHVSEHSEHICFFSNQPQIYLSARDLFSKDLNLWYALLTTHSHLREGVKKYPDEFPISYRIRFIFVHGAMVQSSSQGRTIQAGWDETETEKLDLWKFTTRPRRCTTWAMNWLDGCLTSTLRKLMKMRKRWWSTTPNSWRCQGTTGGSQGT